MDFFQMAHILFALDFNQLHYQFEGHATSGNWTINLSTGEGSDLKCLSQAPDKRGTIRIPQIGGISMQNKYKDHT